MPNPFWICEERLGGTRVGAFVRGACANSTLDAIAAAAILAMIVVTSCIFAVYCSSQPMRRCCAFLLFVSAMCAQNFRAGVARIDITPPVGHPMGGYSDRKQNATGTHDPLYATVLVLESGNESLALVTCDLRSFVSTRVGELARQKFGIHSTIISVSHTHSGPLTWELRSPWYAEAEDKMVKAIGDAKSAMFPATLESATGHIYLGFNRRKVVNGRAP